jgi:hypothetical protein
MSDSKHTPGPWKIHNGYNPSRNKHNASRDIGPSGVAVAEVFGDFEADGRNIKAESMGETGAANARLIAAAPDLLSAAEDRAVPLLMLQLHKALNAVPMDRELAERCEDAIKALQAAIAAARGEG